MTILDIATSVDRLRGELLWFVFAGGGTGSTISFEIGPKVRRAHLLNNPTVSDEVRRYRGLRGLFIQCSWRLDNGHVVLCTSMSSDANEGPMVTNLRVLEGTTIVEAQVTSLAHDLTLRFSNGYTLSVFCDSFDADDDNYSVDLEEATVVVGALGIVRYEPSKPKSPLGPL